LTLRVRGGREKFTPPGSQWSLAGAERVKGDFRKQFGRDLPVKNFGQSAFETSVGWNHENAMDVGIHPNSAEGQWLTQYLKSNNIPFNAFTKRNENERGQNGINGRAYSCGLSKSVAFKSAFEWKINSIKW
jgi:hypothetical protein